MVKTIETEHDVRSRTTYVTEVMEPSGKELARISEWADEMSKICLDDRYTEAYRNLSAAADRLLRYRTMAEEEE